MVKAINRETLICSFLSGCFSCKVSFHNFSLFDYKLISLCEGLRIERCVLILDDQVKDFGEVLGALRQIYYSSTLGVVDSPDLVACCANYHLIFSLLLIIAIRSSAIQAQE